MYIVAFLHSRGVHLSRTRDFETWKTVGGDGGAEGTKLCHSPAPSNRSKTVPTRPDLAETRRILRERIKGRIRCALRVGSR